MKLQCPACSAEMDLDVLLAHDEGRHVLAQLIAKGTQLGPWTLRYIGLFRPAKRALAMSRTLKLLAELWPDMDRQAIQRKGRDWSAPPSVWQQAFEQVIQARDRGALTLPLTSHGYLYEVICGISDKQEATAERQTEQAKRTTPSEHVSHPSHALVRPEPAKADTGGAHFAALRERLAAKGARQSPPDTNVNPAPDAVQ